MWGADGVVIVGGKNGEVLDGRKGPKVVSAADKGKRKEGTKGMGRKRVSEGVSADVGKENSEEVWT